MSIVGHLWVLRPHRVGCHRLLGGNHIVFLFLVHTAIIANLGFIVAVLQMGRYLFIRDRFHTTVTFKETRGFQRLEHLFGLRVNRFTVEFFFARRTDRASLLENPEKTVFATHLLTSTTFIWVSD